MRYHHGFLNCPSVRLPLPRRHDVSYRKARCSTGVAEQSGLASSLALIPSQRLDIGILFAFGNKFLQGQQSVARRGSITRHRHQEDITSVEPSNMSSLKCRLQERKTCEEDLGTRRCKLVSKFSRRVHCICRGDYAVKSMNSIDGSNIINLEF